MRCSAHTTGTRALAARSASVLSGVASASVARLTTAGSLIREPTGFRLVPIQLEAAGVRNAMRPFLLNPIDGAQNIWLGDLRSWATDHVPTARVGNQQAAIGVFDHIGRMKIGLIAFEQDARSCGMGRSGFGQSVPRHTASVELRENQVSFQT